MDFIIGQSSTVLKPVSDYLIARTTEISYFISSVLMIFGSDLIMEQGLMRKLRKMTFLGRTAVFLLYGLLVLPALTIAAAFLLRTVVLEPFKQWIVLMMAVSFLLVGILLSFRYGLKMKLKLK